MGIGFWFGVAAVMIGAGVSLVLDEFALILHLQDVYWSNEGRLSVNLVSLTAAYLGFALTGLSPLGVDNVGDGEFVLRLGAISAIAIHGGLVLACVLKGKYRLSVLALPIPAVALAGAIRLARPGSFWARHWYSAARTARATERAARFDDRWRPAIDRWDSLLGGVPYRRSVWAPPRARPTRRRALSGACRAQQEADARPARPAFQSLPSALSAPRSAVGRASLATRAPASVSTTRARRASPGLGSRPTSPMRSSGAS